MADKVFSSRVRKVYSSKYYIAPKMDKLCNEKYIYACKSWLVAPLNKKTKPEEEKNFNGSALDEGASAESGLQNNGCPKFDFLPKNGIQHIPLYK